MLGNRKEKLKISFTILLLSLVLSVGCAAPPCKSPRVFSGEVIIKRKTCVVVEGVVPVGPGYVTAPWGGYYQSTPPCGNSWHASVVPPTIQPCPPPVGYGEPPNVGWWIYNQPQPQVWYPSSTGLELQFQQNVKRQYFGEPSHQGHHHSGPPRPHGLQPPPPR